VKQEIIGKIVNVEPQAADTYLVELESEALKDVTVFEIVSIGLPFEHIGLDRAGGSRLKLTCTGRSAVHPGEKVKILIDTGKRGGVSWRASKCQETGSAKHRASIRACGYVCRSERSGDSNQRRRSGAPGYRESRGRPKLIEEI